MIYIGDLSNTDANLLASMSLTAFNIIEFGSGASTQIFAQCAPPITEITSVETDPAWIARTKVILEILGHRDRVQFVNYGIIADTVGQRPVYDLVFNDGIVDLRDEFAKFIWPRLKVGGKLLFHDTRRGADAARLLDFCGNRYLEIKSIEMNVDSSNISIITKKSEQPYQNWNISEARNALLVGHGLLNDTIAWVRDAMQRIQSG